MHACIYAMLRVVGQGGVVENIHANSLTHCQAHVDISQELLSFPMHACTDVHFSFMSLTHNRTNMFVTQLILYMHVCVCVHFEESLAENRLRVP